MFSKTSSRREFIKHGSLLFTALSFNPILLKKTDTMKNLNKFDIIIIGGSYSGLSAAMALGRSLRNVLIIDGASPCNIQTPHSHNFLTQDGKTPKEISLIAKEQVAKYNTVKFYSGLATGIKKEDFGFEIRTNLGDTYSAKKIILQLA